MWSNLLGQVILLTLLINFIKISISPICKIFIPLTNIVRAQTFSLPPKITILNFQTEEK